MPVDSSILLGGKTADTSGPLQSLLQQQRALVPLQGQIQGIKANQAVSAAYQQATDPATGKVDQGKLIGLISQNPDAAYNLPQIQGQIQSQQLQQQQLDTSKFDLASRQIGWLKNGLGSLLAQDNIAPSDVTRIALDGVKQNLITPEQAATELANVPTDPKALRAWTQQHFLSAQDGQTQLQALMPKQVSVDTGSQHINYNVSPLTGAATGTQQIFSNEMTPGDANSLTQVYDPASQQMVYRTKSQIANAANAAAPGAQQAPAGGLGSGRMTDPGAAQGQPQGMPQGMPQSAPLAAGPSLGAPEAATVTAHGNATAALALNTQASAAPQSIYQLQNMREALKDINTGPGTDWRQQAKSFVTALAPDVAAKIGIDPQQVASADEFKKYATQAVQSSLAGLGEGTDAKLASAYAANPGPGLSKLANEQLIDTFIAGQRAIAAKNNAWQSSGLPPEQFNRFSNEWNNTVDPRIFTLQDMPRDKAIAMRNNLKPSEQKAFDQSYNAGVARGLIQRIGQ